MTNVQLLEPVKYRGYSFGIGRKLSVPDDTADILVAGSKAKYIAHDEPAAAVLEVDDIVQNLNVELKC